MIAYDKPYVMPGGAEGHSYIMGGSLLCSWGYAQGYDGLGEGYDGLWWVMMGYDGLREGNEFCTNLSQGLCMTFCTNRLLFILLTCM